MRQHLRAFRFKKQDPVCFQIILGVVLIQYDLTGAFDLLRQQLLKLHDLGVSSLQWSTISSSGASGSISTRIFT